MHTNPAIALLYVIAALVPLSGLAAEPLTFEKDVRPIMKAHCFHCHGEGGVKEGMLDVRLQHWMLAGGDSGEAIEPGNPDDSLLLERVVSGEMPPDDKHLSDADIATLREWIAQGAKTARAEPESLDGGDYITEEEKGFWSFQPIRRPEVPKLATAGSDNPIDAFILQRLEQDGLSFSATADRYTLIRRLTFDLWGLPPEPEMVERFIHDSSPDAYANLVDRLLSSPHYGERWGRHWLDVAGYADSDGYTNQDVEREFAYFYRDYVIDSFNDDKPLDQFVREQLAGDELDAEAGGSGSMTPERVARLAATGFLRMAADGTASAGDERELAINTTIADTIDIVSTSLLGLTVGCARCHDHRFDPISQADYHRFRAIFDPALDWKSWKVPNQRQISLYTDEDKKQRAAVEERAKEATAARNQRQQEHIDRTLYEELLVVPDELREPLKAAYQTEKAKRTPEQVALLAEYPSVGSISPGSLYLYAEQRARRAGDIERAANEREARFIAEAQQQLAGVPADKRDELQSVLAITADSRTEAQQALAAKYLDALVTPETLATANPAGFAEVKRYREAAEICRATDAKTELATMLAEIAAIRSTAPKERFLRVLTEPPNHTPESHLFIRGDFQQLGEKLEPDELTVLKTSDPVKIEVNDPNRPTTGRRLAYARHLTDGKHPLLARVLMNRVWLHHFGHGIVDTPGDFGYLGAKPTHPELLDWLADELMSGGWTLKRMHRMIVLSTTYTQDSKRSPQLDRIDPDNRLYARMSIRRLESEAIRDAVLLASGVMADTMHGPPIPVKEDAVGQIVLGEQKLDGERKPIAGEENIDGISRRSIYIQVRRSRPLAVLEAFDIANVVPNCTQRNFSNVAPQALMMMNSEFAIAHAEKLADRVIQPGSDVSQQLAMAWQLCFGRPIEPAVLVELAQFVDRQTAVFLQRNPKWAPDVAHRLAVASACQAMFSSNEFLYVD